MHPIIIGIAGGSCSGKTTFSRRVREKMGEANCSILYQDNYYIDQSDEFDCDGGTVNFDHPEALDFNLMAEHLRKLKRSEIVQVPIYDFYNHKRRNSCLEFYPKKVILVDGILILSQPSIIGLFDTSYFIECDEKTRFQRRLERDVSERGRTPEGVQAQFYQQVNVMHEEFVSPSKINAKNILSQREYLDNCDFYIKELMQRHL